MTAKRESQFCETKGKYMAFFNPMAIVETLIARRRLTLENILNAVFIAKECIKGKSDSWVVYTKLRGEPIAEIISFTKRKPSKQILELMVEGYQDSADDDLALAKEFEGLEPAIDDECSH
jgi:hypothetical protein